MDRRAALRFAALLAGGTLATPLQPARAQTIELIELRHRSAEQLLPLLQPLVEPGGALTGQGFTLFLRASAANVRALRELVARLDVPPRMLLITVRQDRVDTASERGVRADGSVTVTSRDASGAVTVETRNSRSTAVRAGEQQIRVLDGGYARIAMGRAVPFTFRQWVPATGGGWTVVQGTTVIEAVTGFIVQPQLAGEQVLLDIAPEDAAFGAGGSDPRALRLATQVRTRLGEWTALGGADEQTESSRRGGLAAGRVDSGQSRGVWVKVELLP